MYACLIMNRWGLVQQIGPWADTKRDKAERAMPPDNRVGGGTINGGTAHPGTSSVITPRIIQPMKIGILKPSAYARQTIIAPTQVSGTRTKPISGRGGILRMKSGLRPQDTTAFSPYNQTEKDKGNNTTPDYTNTRKQETYDADVATEPGDPDMSTNNENNASVNEWHENTFAGPFGSESTARTLAKQISTLNVDPNPDITGRQKLPIAYTEDDAMDEQVPGYIFGQNNNVEFDEYTTWAEANGADGLLYSRDPSSVFGRSYLQTRQPVNNNPAPMAPPTATPTSSKGPRPIRPGKTSIKSKKGKSKVVVDTDHALKRRREARNRPNHDARLRSVNTNRLNSFNKMSDV